MYLIMFIKYCKNCVMPNTKWENKLDETGIWAAVGFMKLRKK